VGLDFLRNAPLTYADVSEIECLIGCVEESGVGSVADFELIFFSFVVARESQLRKVNDNQLASISWTISKTLTRSRLQPPHLPPDKFIRLDLNPCSPNSHNILNLIKSDDLPTTYLHKNRMAQKYPATQRTAIFTPIIFNRIQLCSGPHEIVDFFGIGAARQVLPVERLYYGCHLLGGIFLDLC